MFWQVTCHGSDHEQVAKLVQHWKEPTCSLEQLTFHGAFPKELLSILSQNLPPKLTSLKISNLVLHEGGGLQEAKQKAAMHEAFKGMHYITHSLLPYVFFYQRHSHPRPIFHTSICFVRRIRTRAAHLLWVFLRISVVGRGESSYAVCRWCVLSEMCEERCVKRDAAQKMCRSEMVCEDEKTKVRHYDLNPFKVSSMAKTPPPLLWRNQQNTARRFFAHWGNSCGRSRAPGLGFEWWKFATETCRRASGARACPRLWAPCSPRGPNCN